MKKISLGSLAQITRWLRTSLLAAGIVVGAPAFAQTTLANLPGVDDELHGLGQYIINTCSALLAAPGAAAQAQGSGRSAGSAQQDLINRCNGAVRRGRSLNPGNVANPLLDTKLASQALNQYAGLQGQGQQSDAMVLNQRVDSFISARMSAAMSGRAAGQAALLQPVQVASLDAADPVYASQGGIRDHGIDGYVVGGWSHGQQSETGKELGFNYDGFWAVGGVDYLMKNKMVVGGALSFASAKADFKSSAAANLSNPGKLDTHVWTATVYGAAPVTDRLDVSGLVGYGAGKFKTARTIVLNDGINVGDGSGNLVNRVETGDPSGHNWQAAVDVTYQLFNSGPLRVSPLAEVSWFESSTDGYTEASNVPTGVFDGLTLNYGRQHQSSFRGIVGVSADRNYNMSFGSLMPYGRVRYIHEFDDGVSSVSARYTAADPALGGFVIQTNAAGKDSFDAALGVRAQFGHGMSAFAEANSVIGLKDTHYYGLSAGVRVEF